MGKIEELKRYRKPRTRQNGQKIEKSQPRGNTQEQATPRDRKTTPREPNANRNKKQGNNAPHINQETGTRTQEETTTPTGTHAPIFEGLRCYNSTSFFI